jgi:hypothetical protein
MLEYLKSIKLTKTFRFRQGGAVTQNSGPDPFEVSDAETMLAYLRSKK